MGLHDFISETEAAHQAGVSIKTLRRFSEAGYLQVEIEPDGLRLYSQHELDEIFGAHRSSSTDGDQSESTDEACSATAATTPDTASSYEEVTSSAQPTGATASQECDVSAASSSPKTEPTTTQENSSHQHPVIEPSSASEEKVDASLYAIEILKLRNVISLQEKLLDTKDAEIADLRGQRDWLRARVEKLEEKSDRDQILLLSETQTIRKLISLQEQKRSPMNRFLEWLGIAPPQTVKALGSNSEYANSDTISTTSREIEVKSAAHE